MSEKLENNGIVKQIEINNSKIDNLLQKINELRDLIQPIRQLPPPNCEDSVSLSSDSNNSSMLESLQCQYREIDKIQELIKLIIKEIQL